MEQFGWTHGIIENHTIRKPKVKSKTKRKHTIGKTNRCGTSVPHQFSDANKATRVNMAGILFRNAKNSGFFDSNVASDEKWIHYDHPFRLDPGEHPKQRQNLIYMEKSLCFGFGETVLSAGSWSNVYGRPLHTTIEPFRPRVASSRRGYNDDKIFTGLRPAVHRKDHATENRGIRLGTSAASAL